MHIITTEHLPEGAELGELLTAVAVSSVNVVKDFRENIRNLTGGDMHHYERLLERTLARGLEKIQAQAQSKGYDGLVGLKIAHPNIVDSCAEIILYANGFRYPQSDAVKP